MNAAFIQDPVSDQDIPDALQKCMDLYIHFPELALLNLAVIRAEVASCDVWLYLLHLLKSAFQMSEIGKITY